MERDYASGGNFKKAGLKGGFSQGPSSFSSIDFATKDDTPPHLPIVCVCRRKSCLAGVAAAQGTHGDRQPALHLAPYHK